MQVSIYQKEFQRHFESTELRENILKVVDMIRPVRKIFFIGNGGSNAICSHMMEDYAKIGGFQTYSFSDPALITCFANDYGYENAIAEWLRIYFDESDVLIAVSSSGRSANILNAVNIAVNKNGKIITLSGFKNDNPLRGKGTINFYVDIENYGIVECFHQVILHAILDELQAS